MQQINRSNTPKELAAEQEDSLEVAAVIAAALAAYGGQKPKIASIRLTTPKLWASAARLEMAR
ncbi:MAG: hypothetical protein LBR56_04770 [Sporomusaceae bacterium]|jgi:hypothetical protein|nr:hypothetical protein [Sporomusaceae bacterium]